MPRAMQVACILEIPHHAYALRGLMYACVVGTWFLVSSCHEFGLCVCASGSVCLGSKLSEFEAM